MADSREGPWSLVAGVLIGILLNVAGAIVSVRLAMTVAARHLQDPDTLAFMALPVLQGLWLLPLYSYLNRHDRGLAARGVTGAAILTAFFVIGAVILISIVFWGHGP